MIADLLLDQLAKDVRFINAGALLYLAFVRST
jgi:hypothetical protein